MDGTGEGEAALKEGLGRARGAMARGDLAAARQLYEDLVQAHPDRVRAWVGLAQTAGRAGDWARALEAWDGALKLGEPGPPFWHAGRMRALFRVGAFQPAVQAARDLLEEAPDNDSGREILARALAAQHDEAALRQEAEHGHLRLGRTASDAIAHLRAWLALREWERGQDAFTVALERAEDVAQLRVLFRRIPYCFGEDARARAWQAIDGCLADVKGEAAAIHTLALRIRLALRDHAGFAARWATAPETEPEWQPRFAALAARLASPAEAPHPRIFGIGLPKTGTTSLARALETLGFAAAHFANPFSEAMLADADFELFEACNDLPVAAAFERLYARFPDARFVYTTRPVAEWADSMRRHQALSGESDDPAVQERVWTRGGRANPRFRLAALFREVFWPHPDMEHAYLAWDSRVRAFFAGDPTRLLVLDVSAPDAWTKLGAFLGRDAPATPFPHENRNPFLRHEAGPDPDGEPA